MTSFHGVGMDFFWNCTISKGVGLEVGVKKDPSYSVEGYFMEKAHYLVCIIIEKTIKQEIAIKQRPFTLNVLKDFQFSRFIVEPVGILSNII